MHKEHCEAQVWSKESIALQNITAPDCWWIMKEDWHLFWESWALKYLLKIRVLLRQGATVSSWAMSELNQSQQEEYD